ncbi:MAG: hypothetical protein Q4E12_07055 [Coriobacteriia bacterium]|nr:hypothetical protein [Coriobacteriia bacterium]
MAAKKYTFFNVLDELDAGVDDEAALVHLALKSGLRLTPDEAMELLYYDTGADQAIINATEGDFTPEQLAEINEFMAEA